MTKKPFKPFISFPVDTGSRIEERATQKFNDRYNPDSPFFSLRFIVFLTLGFVITIAAVLWFAPAIDQNPIFVLSFLVFISVLIWYLINRDAKRTRYGK